MGARRQGKPRVRPRGVRRALRITKYVVLIALAVVVLGVAAVAIVLQTAWGRGKVRDAIVHAMSDSFPCGATIGALEGNVLGDATLRDVVFTGCDGVQAVKLDKVEVNVALTSLLDATIRLEHVRVDGGTIDVHAAEGEPLNVVAMFQPSPEPFAWDVALPEIEAKGLALAVDLPTYSGHFDGISIGASADVRLAGSVAVKAAIGGGWRERALAAHAEADLMITDGVVRASSFAASLTEPTGAVISAAGAAAGTAIVTVTGADVEYRSATDVRGHVEVTAAENALARILPDNAATPALQLAFDVAPANGEALGVRVGGTVRTAPVTGWVRVAPAESPLRLAGVVRAEGVDARWFSPAAVATDATATAVFGLVLDPEPVPGRVDPASTPSGIAPIRIPVAGIAAISATGDVGGRKIEALAGHAAFSGHHVGAIVRAEGPGASTALVAGGVVFGADRTLAVLPTRVIAHVGDVHALVPDAGARGELDADVVVSAQLGANRAIAIDGRVIATRPRRGNVGASRVAVDVNHVTLDPDAPAKATGELVATITGGRVGASSVPTLTVTVASRSDGDFGLRARSSGPHLGSGGPWSADVNGVATLGEDFRSASIRLDDYRVSTGGLAWSGSGGTIAASPERITVREIAATSGKSRFAVDGTVGLRDGDVDGQVELVGVELADLDRTFGLSAGSDRALRGTAALAIDVQRDKGKSGAITGSVTGSVRGFALRPEATPIDVTLDVALLPERLTGHVVASGALGTADVAVDVDRPRDLTDPHAWERLERRAIRTATVRATDLDLAVLARALGIDAPVDGHVTASLDFTAAGSTGEIHARDVVIAGVPGMLDADMTMELVRDGVVDATADIRLRDIATATIEASFTVPSRPLDVRAWAALDLHALHGATVTVSEITVDQAVAGRFGLGSIRGRLAGSVDVAEAASALTARVVARGVTGGPLARPVDIVAEVTLDDDGLRGSLVGSLDGVAVLNAEASAPVDPAALADDGLDALRGVHITGAGTLLPTKLGPLVQTLGQDIRSSATIHGSGTFSGTIDAPITSGSLVIEGLGGKNTRIEKVVVDGRYADGVLTATLDAKATKGTLVASAKYVVGHPEQAEAELNARTFQIGPLVRLIPEVVGIRGVVDGHLTVKGLDPETAVADGKLKITGGQLPIADQVGALTDATIDVAFTPGKATLTLKGMIETGDVELEAEATLDGLLPRTATIDASVRDLAIINALQPRIAASLHAEVVKNGDGWKVDATLSDGRVVIPDDGGTPLHPTGAPLDMVFIENGQVKRSARAVLAALIGRRPSLPFLVVGIEIEPVSVVSKELRGEVSGHLDLSIGDDGLWLVGSVAARRGEVMVFDRRYMLRQAAVRFDGGIDPLVELQMSHEFPELTLEVSIKGRLSNPDPPQFTPVPGYSEGQLLGFLLGGSPGSSTQDTRTALTSAATAVATQALTGFVTRRLPVKVDVLRYEPETSSSSSAFVIGDWITSRLLVLLRTRTQAREDENRGETELELWLGRRLLLEAVGGDKGVLGLDLLWTRRW
jgi:hypothetical protein